MQQALSAPGNLTRRQLLSALIVGAAGLATPGMTAAAQSQAFARWLAGFRPRALGRGISEQTFDRVMNGVTPDMSVLAQFQSQPEFTELLWQYINRRCSDWRVMTGKERAKEYAPLLTRIEKDYGVDRYTMLGLWGMESSFGDLVVNPKYMQPIIPSLSALAFGEARRRAYWESELINALAVVDRGWAASADMVGSWAGAMGHTQWMPEVWLHMGVDYDHDGRISPFGRPDDSFAGTARFLVERGQYRRGETWGCEVIAPNPRLANGRVMHSYARWEELGVRRADGTKSVNRQQSVRLWIPVEGGPAFLIGQNFRAVRAYNPSNSYTLALCHLGDLIRGDPPFRQHFPDSERTPTLAEVKEIQRRLNEQGFQTDGVDGRVGSGTIRAIQAYQRKVGIEPADGYAGLKLLARLRQGP